MMQAVDLPVRCVRSICCIIIFTNWVIIGNAFDEHVDTADGSFDLGGEYQVLLDLLCLMGLLLDGQKSSLRRYGLY